jgi:ligand-binding sensor domain-containing protein
VQLNAQQQMGSFIAYGPEAKYFSNLNFRVYQSKNGYLWIGTQNGLVRFDGKRYKNYFSNHADPNSPSDNSIVDIIEDKNGDLWFCGFFRGVTRYNQQTGKFKKYPRLSVDNFPYYGIQVGLKDSEDNLWFCTAGRGLARYVYEKDSFVLYFPEPDKSKDGTIKEDNNVTDICEDPSDKKILWISTFKGLYSFDKRTKLFKHFPSGIKSIYSVDVLAVSVEPDTKGNIWLGTWGEGIFCFDPRTKKYMYERCQKIPAVGNDIRQVNDSLLYIAGLNEGLFLLNLLSNTVENITPPHSQVNGAVLKHDIQKVSVTHDAGIFVGGNYYVYQQHPAFNRMRKNISYAGVKSEKENIELNDGVWDEKNKVYWLATSGGAGIYMLQKDKVKAEPVHIQPALPPGSNFNSPYFIDRSPVYSVPHSTGIISA